MESKAEFINAHIKYKYDRNENIIICDNSNLLDEKFRTADGIHLTSHGTSVFATNLKYKVAEALGIEVKRKPRNREQRRRGFFEDDRR